MPSESQFMKNTENTPRADAALQARQRADICAELGQIVPRPVESNRIENLMSDISTAPLFMASAGGSLREVPLAILLSEDPEVSSRPEPSLGQRYATESSSFFQCMPSCNKGNHD
jgi:hypothetical protein